MVFEDSFVSEVAELLKEKLNMPFDRSVLSGETLLGATGLGLESVAIVELCIHLELKYDITIPDDDIDKIARMSLRSLRDYVLQVPV